MAITPYRDLKTEDILAAHISGLQHSVNKIEEVLNMKTQIVINETLYPVTDQDDPSLRYRIYEGKIRGWLDNPAPVIYRNGEVVPASEYVISPGHGVVVFHQQQLSTDEISADFDCVIAESSVLEQILQQIADLQNRLTLLESR
jgi:conjugal transfer/entry exclusion protein